MVIGETLSLEVKVKGITQSSLAQGICYGRTCSPVWRPTTKIVLSKAVNQFPPDSTACKAFVIFTFYFSVFSPSSEWTHESSVSSSTSRRTRQLIQCRLHFSR